jgi:hypothetical protein
VRLVKRDQQTGKRERERERERETLMTRQQCDLSKETTAIGFKVSKGFK